MGKFSPATRQTRILAEYEALKLGAFVHLNMQQFVYTKDEFTLENDPKLWNPTQLDVEQWFRRWREAGIRYATLSTKHTSDFCLWDTKTTASNVMNSPVPVDIVAEFVRCARKYDIKPCFYFCIWGGAFNSKPDAEALLLQQLDELATSYGDIFMFWLDMANWRPDGLTIQGIYDFIKERQPNTLIHYNQHIQDGSEIRYFPTDLLNGEERIPPEEGHQKLRTVDGTVYYLPFEYEACLQHVDEDVGKGYTRGTRWFTYSGGAEGMSVSHPAPRTIYPFIRKAYDRGASNVMLSTAPDHTGLVREQDIAAICQLRDLIDSHAADTITPGSAVMEIDIKSAEILQVSRTELRFRVSEDRIVTALGKYCRNRQGQETLVELTDADGTVLAAARIAPDADCDMLGLQYGCCSQNIPLQANREYAICCREEGQTQYREVSLSASAPIEIISPTHDLLGFICHGF